MADPGADAPIQVLELEMTEPLPALTARASLDATPYAAARILVRLHSHPIGLLDIALSSEPIEPALLARRIDEQLGTQLRAHRDADGLPVQVLPSKGYKADPAPSCLSQRRSLLTDAPAVSVVIPTHGRPELIVNCIRAVLASDYPPECFQVIVVDNVPPDALTHDAVTGAFANEPRVSYLRCETPGSAAARNAGIEYADSEFVAVADDDVIVDRHWLSELVAALISDASITCVTGAILPLELETQSQVLFERFGGFHKGFAPLAWSEQQPPQDDPLFPYTAGRFGAGCNVGYRRDAIRAIGGYDETFFPIVCEDFELFLRVARSGAVIAYQPTALVWHRHRRDPASLHKVLCDYGTGVSAAITRTILNDRSAIAEIASRLPKALAYLFSSHSAKNAGRGENYPSSLRVRELRGVLRGPHAYLTSRRAARRRQEG